MFCFPYAGGSATVFREWVGAFGDSIEVVPVELPGHGSRLGEPALRDVRAVAAGAAEALFPYLDRPFAVFGHSYGALVGFEIVQALSNAGRPPACLFSSGSRAPQLPAQRRLAALPNDALIEALWELNGTPSEILDDRHLIELVLPIVRADLAADEAYIAAAGTTVKCPVMALGGRNDPAVTRGAVASWAGVTRAEFNQRMLPGDHFFLHASRPLVVALVRQELQRIVGGTG
jgi:surfactin synthase thioesterase subunit